MNMRIESTVLQSVDYHHQELYARGTNYDMYLQNYQLNTSQTQIVNIQNKKRKQNYISTKGRKVLTAPDVRLVFFFTFKLLNSPNRQELESKKKQKEEQENKQKRNLLKKRTKEVEKLQ